MGGGPPTVGQALVHLPDQLLIYLITQMESEVTQEYGCILMVSGNTKYAIHIILLHKF